MSVSSDLLPDKAAPAEAQISEQHASEPPPQIKETPADPKEDTAINVTLDTAAEVEELTRPKQIAAIEQDTEDEEEIVTRPRSRAKKLPGPLHDDDESAAKRLKTEAASVDEVAAAVLPIKVVSTAPPSNDDDDEEGNTKVDADGALMGDRTYTSRAFRLPTRGDTYYFLATEIARVSGYRDSYLLFNKNRNLRKLMTTEAEKAFLIQQELIPYSYRNRQIGVVNALTIYKTFGSKIIVKGKRVKDDYFAQRARDQGFTEDDFANEEDRPVEDRMNEIAEAQRRAETEAEIALANNAKSAVDYNAMINEQRKARDSARRQHFKRSWTAGRLMPA